MSNEKKKNKIGIFYNKDAKTTTVVFRDTREDGVNYLRRRTDDFDVFFPDDYFRRIKPNGKNIVFPNTVSATVRCNENDVWDEEEGLREAFAKADKKHRKELDRYILKWMIKVLNTLKNVDKYLYEEAVRKVKRRKG